MGQITDWALDQLGHLPSVPGPFLVAFFILFVLIGPTIARALKSRPEPPSAPIEAVPHVLLDASSVYTILVNIELQLARIQGRLDIMESMMRRRHKRPSKTPKVG